LENSRKSGAFAAQPAVTALIKDQVTPMLYRKPIVSTRTLFPVTVALTIFVCAVGAAFAANTGVAPVLVPYTITSLAGNTQYSATGVAPPGGFGGDNQLGANATLSSPDAVAIDSVGNVYIADTNNAIIRELNVQTGILTTIAGKNPTSCIGTVCTQTNSGCADGVAAVRNPIGSAIHGLAVDAYGNVYFSDQTAQTISVIYRGGAQVASFIALEDPTGIATPQSGGAVQPGFVYHVGGTINLATCAATSGNTDNALAFQGAALHSPGQLGIDSAGNIYVQDVGNNSVRVINAQSTSQTFFQYAVQPGFMRAIANCSATLTAPCPTTTTTATTEGINGPANAVYFSQDLSGMGVDGYGNVYELITKGCTTNCYGGVAYAGGAPLAHLINLESGQTATYGDFYAVMDNPALSTPTLPAIYGPVLANGTSNLNIRPTSVNADALGNLWYWDNHYPEVSRIDVNSQVAITVVAFGRTIGGNGSAPASNTNPIYCVYGTTTAPFTQGPQTNDPRGDGCPAVLGVVGGGAYLIADGPGNIYLDDGGNELIRELPLGNYFPVTPMGTPVTQAVQVHFDASNNPAQVGVAPNITTTAFAIAPGITDFTINTTTPEFAMGAISTTSYKATAPGLALVSSAPTCSALASAANDASLDCLVYVTFNPTAPGVRQAQLVATTANGSVYNFSLSGVGSGGQLAIDGGRQAVVPATGLGNTAGVAVTQSGTLYIADPANNRVVVEPAGGGAQTTIGTGLKGPMGVAVDAAANVYISDTGNNRIVKINPVTGVQTVLGASIAVGIPAYPQYSFNKPQGIAVDALGNVYVADTGNAKVVEITSNPALGGAVPLLAYPGAPKFITPVAVAVDSQGYIYVADQGNVAGEIVKLPPGGGDLVTIPGSSFPLLGGNGITTPNGVAVDGGGNVYVSDRTTNTVWEAPAVGPPNGNPFTLGFTGLSSPAGLAVDANGNLYVADSGNKQVLFDNRQNPLVSFGTVPQDLSAPSGVAGTPAGCPINGNSTPCTGLLTVTNIGTKPVALTSPFISAANVSPAGDTAFNVTNTCVSPLLAGATCTVSPTFYPTSDGSQSENLNVNGGTQSIALVASTQGTGEQPLVNIVLTAGYSSGGLAAGSTATVTATVTQPHIPGNTPTGTVTFTYVIDASNPSPACGSGGTVTVPLTGTGGTATASFPLPTLLIGRNYAINATYNSDTLNSLTLATPLVLQVPGVQPLTVIANSVSYAYGQPVPAITGTVTGILPADNVTYSFTSAATPSTPIGTYPITVTFAGGNYCNYGFPPALTSTGAPAVVTENPAPLTVVTPAYTTPYGAADLNYFALLLPNITGAVNGDLPKFSATFTPPHSSILNVGTYTVVPTLTGKPIGNYTVKVTNGTLTVTSAPTTIGVSAAKSSILPTALSTATFNISVTSLVTSGLGTPSGTVTITDNFTPVGNVTNPLTSVATASGGNTVYTGTFPGGAGNAFQGNYYAISGFTNAGNNGTFACVGSTATTITLANTAGVSETASATASGTFPNAPVTIGPLPLVAGSVLYTPTSTALGTHFYSYAYSGDSNFQASKTLTTTNLLVDNADFTLTSSTGVVAILPGVIPSGNGLPSATGQSASTLESAVITITSVLSEANTVSLTCQPQNPSYVSCTMTPPQVTIAASGTTAIQTSVISICSPATLPLGYTFNGTVSNCTLQNTSAHLDGRPGSMRSSGTETVLAFLPFGFLAFCLRRRRRLSKALWMLIAIAAVSAGMSGCGGNSVAFFTPVPQGPQTVTVTATAISNTNQAVVTRTFVVPISID